jgi:DnaJ-class molecular chaperone
MGTMEILVPCKFCTGQVTCEAKSFASCENCLGTGQVWDEKLYVGELDDGEFLYWQVRLNV